jgi:serine/threonine-protein kinase
MGIVHRDVTPSNIMLLHAGGVKILDFGIAKAGEAASGEEAGGAVKGKLRYLAPEQVRLEDVDARADIFALGVTLWEMLTGKRLFAGENELETLQNVLQKPVPPPSAVRAGVPADLDRVVLRALERDPQRRYGTADELANDLEQILREARYESQSLRRLLRELFGEESSSRSLEMPDLPEEPEGTPQPAPKLPSVEIEFIEGTQPGGAGAAAAIPRTRSVAPPFGVATSTSPLLPEVRRAAALRRLGSVALVVALLAGAAVAAYTLRGRPAPPALAVAAASAPEVAPAAAAVVPAPAPAPARVKLSFASSPAGAAVAGADGTPLGVTPFSIEVPRSDRRQTFTFAKPGWQSAIYEATPDRDVAALIELQRGRGATAKKPKRAPNARTLGDGMTINPF